MCWWSSRRRKIKIVECRDFLKILQPASDCSTIHDYRIENRVAHCFDIVHIGIFKFVVNVGIGILEFGAEHGSKCVQIDNLGL